MSTIPAGLKDVLSEAIKEELQLGGDAGSVVSCVGDTLAEERYDIRPSESIRRAIS